MKTGILGQNGRKRENGDGRETISGSPPSPRSSLRLPTRAVLGKVRSPSESIPENIPPVAIPSAFLLFHPLNSSSSL
jgi:hypothetical protein